MQKVKGNIGVGFVLESWGKSPNEVPTNSIVENHSLGQIIKNMNLQVDIWNMHITLKSPAIALWGELGNKQNFLYSGYIKSGNNKII